MIDMDRQFEQLDLIDRLSAVLARLPRRDNVFGGMMRKAFDYYGSLTPRQEAVVREILARAGA